VPASHVIAFQNQSDAHEMMRRLRKYFELHGNWPDPAPTMFKELSEIDSVQGPLRDVSADLTLETSRFQALRDRILYNAQALDWIREVDFETNTSHIQTFAPLRHSRKLVTKMLRKALELQVE
jgi:hypothetical protein